MSVDAALLLMALFWAANMIVLKSLLDHLPPPALSCVRFALVALVGLVVLAAKGGPFRVERRDWPKLLASALLGITLYQVLFMEGLARTTAFVSNLMQGTEPLFALLLLRLVGRKVLARQWAGVLAAFLGAVLFFLQEAKAGFRLAFGLGDLLNVTSAVAFAAYGLLSGDLFARYPGRTVMALSMALGALPLVPWSWRELVATDWVALPWGVWLALLYSALLPVYVGYWIWNWAVAKKGLAHASLYIFVDIVVTGVFAWLFLGERFGALRLLGAAVILAGVRLAR
ncbi:MAG TPA: DMT family transporter [Vicinamibacteria bacterium]|nr:DMT family transporter [Vicinamibacteria bacterium]